VNVDGTWRIASRDVSVPRSCLFFLLEDNASSAPAAGGEEGGEEAGFLPLKLEYDRLTPRLDVPTSGRLDKSAPS